MLAMHILSISANSALCEHLFSSFGNILIKLHNQMSTKTLSTFGELKLHIHNQHHKYDTKQHVKDQMFMKATNPDTTVLRTLPGPIEIELPIDPALFYTDDKSGGGDLYEEEDDTDVDVDLMIS